MRTAISTRPNSAEPLRIGRASVAGWEGLTRAAISMTVRGAFTACLGACLIASAYAQPKLPPVRQSEQFTVIDARPVSSRSPGRLTNPAGYDLIKLDADVLLLSAERIKEVFHWELERTGQRPGRIRLALFPAVRATDRAALVSSYTPSGWEYRLELPDQIEDLTLVRGVVQSLLLEYANRGQGPKSAELPIWLVEGLTAHLISVAGPDLVVTAVPLGAMHRIIREKSGLDRLQSTREVLRANAPLAFSELAYPLPETLQGDRLKIFQASAHLFVYELLRARNGRAKLLAMLRELPNCWNWETALLHAYSTEYHRMLDVEKKWSVDALAFTSRDPSQIWSHVETLGQLDQILSLPAQVRVGSHLLPERQTMTLQQLIAARSFAEQTAVVRQKLRLLEVLRFHSPPQLAPLIENYHRVLSNYVRKRELSSRAPETRMQTALSQSLSAQDVIKDLDRLDKEREAMRPENALTVRTPAAP